MNSALLSRFLKLDLKPYTVDQRKAVITHFLQQRDGMTAAEAVEVADLVAPRSGDVRDAERIAEVRRTNPELAAKLAARLGTAAVA